MTFNTFTLLTLRVVTLSLLILDTSGVFSRAAQQPLESFVEGNIKFTSSDAISSSVEKRPNHSEKIDVNPLAIAAKHILNTMRETHYTHKTFVDKINGVYDMDCSGFVGYVLNQIAPEYLALIPKEPKQPRPRAFKYYEYFHQLQQHSTSVREWKAINQLMDAMPGDIIAWAMEPITEHADTGHVMFVAAKPVMNSDGTVSVKVYDSTAIRHNDDTRSPNSTGIGCGTIVFRVDANGAPVAFQFNTRAKFHELPIAIGRSKIYER
ncbi:MAG: hypothetical protein V7K67_22085 [Nostoc sp.]|uniref:hypothetical protein n=1 Tax=Nostoc sp. TaxID=1180 RepID=UPI002FF46C2C